MFPSQKAVFKFLRGMCLAGVIAAGSVQSALAQEQVTEWTRVSARGLDLTTPAGESALRKRVLVAVYHVCGEDDGSVSLESDSFRQCVSDALRGSQPQVQALVASARNKNQYATASGSRQ